jgi:hypothetical protein
MWQVKRLVESGLQTRIHAAAAWKMEMAMMIDEMSEER